MPEQNNTNLRDSSRLIGSGPEFSDMLQQVSAVAALRKPVLIVGERGTGKELVASRTHFLSDRWDKTLETLNCAAISDSLIESELFGHESGAFTGASRRHAGRFERSHGGSLFLDELATTSTRVQEQLLRVIEYGEFQRLGGSEVLRTDVRLIAATNEDLPTLAEQGKFRFDLLDRLSFDVITLPPLRARADDIPELAQHFATGMSLELGRDYFAGFSDSAMQQLMQHPWPGNVRELKNTVERSTYRHQDWQEPLTSIVLDPFDSPYRPQSKAPRNTEKTNTAKAANSGAAKPRIPAFGDSYSLRHWLDTEEKRWIAQALANNRYNQAESARSLGLSYHQLRASLRKFPDIKLR